MPLKSLTLQHYRIFIEIDFDKYSNVIDNKNFEADSRRLMGFVFVIFIANVIYIFFLFLLLCIDTNWTSHSIFRILLNRNQCDCVFNIFIASL